MLSSRLLTCALVLAGATTAVARLQPALFQQGAQPSAEHAILQKAVGTWEGKVVMFGPDGEQAFEAKETTKSLGGFWKTSVLECEFMGMPYTGMSTYGYDPRTKKYVGTWIDNMKPNMDVMEGTYLEDKGVLEMRWDSPDMMSGAMAPHRSEMKLTDTSYTLTFFVGKEETKTMEITMKRTGKKPMSAGYAK